MLPNSFRRCNYGIATRYTGLCKQKIHQKCCRTNSFATLAVDVYLYLEASATYEYKYVQHYQAAIATRYRAVKTLIVTHIVYTT